MSESFEICIHELPISSCSYCKHSKSDLPKFVYVTKGGDVFHKRKDCEALESGQLYASRMNLSTHEIEQVALNSVLDRRVCEWCLPNATR